MYDDFVKALVAAGGKATNRQLQLALGIDKPQYLAIRYALILHGLVKPMRGRGGSVVYTGEPLDAS